GHAVGLALVGGEHARRRQLADVAAERSGALPREQDRTGRLLRRPERAHSPSAIGVPPWARMRAAKIAAFRAPPTAMQPTGTPGGICAMASSASMPPRPPDEIGTP